MKKIPYNHIEVMLHLHVLQKELKKVIRRYGKGQPGNIANSSTGELILQHGVLSIHAIGHNAHNLSIYIAKASGGFNSDNYETKQQLIHSAHMKNTDHTNLWDPENCREYDKEKKGK